MLSKSVLSKVRLTRIPVLTRSMAIYMICHLAFINGKVEISTFEFKLIGMLVQGAYVKTLIYKSTVKLQSPHASVSE